MRANLIRLVVLIVAGAWLVLLGLGGIHVETTAFFRPFSVGSGLAVILAQVFECWLWRYLPRHARPPLLRGTWRGELQSDWVDPKTGTQIGPIEVYMRVQQTYSSVRTRVMTGKMESPSLAASLTHEPDGTYRLVVTYRSDTELRQRKENPIHYGTMMLRIIDTDPPTLDGTYWTDRNTRGEIRFSSRCDRLYSGFGQAREESNLTS